jgi:hypothetical protein
MDATLTLWGRSICLAATSKPPTKPPLDSSEARVPRASPALPLSADRNLVETQQLSEPEIIALAKRNARDT